MGEEITTKSAAAAVDDALRGRKRVRGSRHAERMIAANVTVEELAVISAHAKRAGYATLAEYVRAVALSPRPVYDTDAARVAQPLAAISVRLARCLDVLDRNETDALRGYLEEMQRIVADALQSLRREHDAEVRSNR